MVCHVPHLCQFISILAWCYKFRSKFLNLNKKDEDSFVVFPFTKNSSTDQNISSFYVIAKDDKLRKKSLNICWKNFNPTSRHCVCTVHFGGKRTYENSIPIIRKVFKEKMSRNSLGLVQTAMANLSIINLLRVLLVWEC